jgi:hypothetical protein
LLERIKKDEGFIEDIRMFPVSKIEDNTIGYLFIKINNSKKLDEFISKITSKIEGGEKKEESKEVVKLYLDEEGKLYWINEAGKKFTYPMKTNKLRYKIVHYLANKKQFIPTQEIADDLVVNKKKIRETIGKIRMEIKKHCHINGNKVIEGKVGKGYRVKCVEIMESTES